MNTHLNSPVQLWAWSLDFLRAYNEHSKIRKWLIHIFLGKHCIKEMKGLEEALNSTGSDTKREYGLKNVKYEKF